MWSAPELVVAYGQYVNEIAQRNYEDWKALDAETRGKVERPKQYNVRFYGVVDG